MERPRHQPCHGAARFTFILAATIKNAPYLMSARTLEKSRIVLIPSQDVRAIFDVDGNFARAIVTELAQCYRSVIKSQKDSQAADLA
jgi:CRP/FNR family transcriptional activator FtrB